MKPYYDRDGITIYHGDSREVLPTLGTFDAVVTDPPYGIAGSSGTINKARGKSLYQGAWPDDAWAVREVFAPVVRDALARCGGRGAITPGTPHAWEYPKPDDMAAVLQPSTQGMSKWGRATWQPILLYGRDPRVGLTIQPLTFTSNGRFTPSAHPCPKPDDIAHWMVMRATLDGEALLDPFAGSGTFLVHAALQGRSAVGIEIEERYCEIAAKRLAQGVLPFSGGLDDAEHIAKQAGKPK